MVPLVENLQQPMTEVDEENGCLKAQIKPFPATIPENDVLGFTGIWIAWGKPVQLRRKTGWLGGLVIAQINVWLEVSEIDTVESEKTSGRQETKDKHMSRSMRKLDLSKIKAIEMICWFW